MKLNRIINLLKYDWSLYKRNYFMALGIAAGLFILGTCITFLWQLLVNDNPANMPAKLIIFASNFVSYGSIVMVLLVTVILHHKFTNPRTATAYLTLPGTSAEKLAAMCIDYIAGALTLRAVAYLGMAISFLLGLAILPDANWMAYIKCNNIMEMYDLLFAGMVPANVSEAESITGAMDMMDQAMPGFGDMFANIIHTSIWFAGFSASANCLFYVMLNLLYKKNAQLKAIATEIGLGVIFAICMIGYVVFLIFTQKESWSPVAANGDVSASNLTGPLVFMTHIVNLILTFLRLTPVICAILLGIVYKQISKKQPF